MDHCDDKNPADEDGMTPLHNAALQGHVEVCDLIIQNVKNKHPRDNDGKTPLDYAQQEDVTELFRNM